VDKSRLTQILRGTQTVGLDYDDAGRRTLLTLPNGVSTEYQYDTASRLTGLIYRNAAGTLGNLTYQYDPAGNRTGVGGSFARTLLPAAIATATYDAANRQRAFGPSQMAFDANGNLTTLTDATQTTSLTWDARDRLIGVEQPGTLASFAYAFGRRAAKTVNGAATQFLYDGLDIAQQLEAQRITSYLRSLAIDETLGLTSPDGAFFLTADALGSTVAVTDNSGTALTEYTYDSFGLVSATNAAFPNPYQFTGRENDGLAGLYYYRARYYDATRGRFISEDPLDFGGGDLNLFAYVSSNPLKFVDPTGMALVLETDSAMMSTAWLSAECRDYFRRSGDRQVGGRKPFSILGSLNTLSLELSCDPALELFPIAGASSGAVRFTAGQLRQFERQLATHGRRSLERSLATFERRLAEHLQDLQRYEEAGGYTSSIKREIANFRQQINAIKEMLGRQP